MLAVWAVTNVKEEEEEGEAEEEVAEEEEEVDCWRQSPMGSC